MQKYTVSLMFLGLFLITPVLITPSHGDEGIPPCLEVEELKVFLKDWEKSGKKQQMKDQKGHAWLVQKAPPPVDLETIKMEKGKTAKTLSRRICSYHFTWYNPKKESEKTSTVLIASLPNLN